MKLLYPTSLKLDVDSLQGFSVDLVPYDVKTTIPEEHTDAEILVTWTNSADNLKDAAARLKNIKWIQSLAAGPNDVLSAGFDTSKVTVTTGSGLHDHTVAEHALGLLLNAARRFYEMRDYQLQSKWPGHLGGPQPDRPAHHPPRRPRAHLGLRQHRQVAHPAPPRPRRPGQGRRAQRRYPRRRRGLRRGQARRAPPRDRRPRHDPPRLRVHQERAQRRAPQAAAQARVDRQRRPRRPLTIDEEALVDALEAGEVGGAALDVFVTEPLPESSRLWKAPNVVVSPHAAGGRPQGAEALIAYNLRRFRASQSLKNVI
ncbi:D-isomer specific 2-hydroxyacid dehydrogenase [Colletotrichum scovillei]|uniref:D-isomer specific 2-hydroxyacid dehydrogenase n=1 Tax=Colletotrichum scovillei TaxID=1209932 RepID=UPI0015C2C875|nr:D-isomer specific 2-hydroxyacid dehydrogenase [Colletotrichum scovillei]KAF4776511.1 D-isomer specific 2-hydroxyacid dehydrogenase [Colletotrichum scovillei]